MQTLLAVPCSSGQSCGEKGEELQQSDAQTQPICKSSTELAPSAAGSLWAGQDVLQRGGRVQVWQQQSAERLLGLL